MILTRNLSDFLDGLLHSSVSSDAMARARHRAFIAARLLGSLPLLASFPLYLAIRGAPTALEVMVFAWLIVPVAIACFLSRNGGLEVAGVMSSVALTGILLGIAVRTGGIESFAALWLVVVPIEAALSASRRIVAFAITLALTAALALMVLTFADLLPASSVPNHLARAFAGGSVVGVLLYCAALALVSGMLAHTGVALLNAEEDRYRLLARHMSDVISRHRGNGAVDFISPAAEKLFGVPASALLGHGLFDRVHVADRPAYLTALSQAGRGEGERSVEFRVRRLMTLSDTEISPVTFVWIEMRCRPLASATDNAAEAGAGVVAVLRDVTERKAQDQELDAARAEAQKADASKSKFLAAISHELRTPLNAVIGFSEMIVREEDLGLDAPRRREYAQLINDSGQHLLSIVNDILDMSKMESGNFEIWPEPFMPRAAILNCCELMALKAREGGVDLIVRAPAELPAMVGDQRALKQILLNLLSNAIKFTDRDGSIVVSAAVDGDNLAMRVTDTGIGIGADDLKRLGDPFFQAGKTYQRRHEGTGLGLSIVKALVALHRGQMTVQSRIDEGTSVSITLPLNLERAIPQSVSTITMLPPARANQSDVGVRKSA